MTEKLKQLIKLYKTLKLENSDELLQGVTPQQINVLEESLGITLHESLKKLLSIYGGQDELDCGIIGLFGQHRLFSKDEIISSYKNNYMYIWEEGDYNEADEPGKNHFHWHPNLIPFAGWDSYELVMCYKTGKIWEFEPYRGLSSKTFQSLEELFEKLSKKLLNGQIELDHIFIEEN